MKSLVSLGMAAMAIMFAAGCCCPRQYACVNPCTPDPCEAVIAGCGHSTWFQRKVQHWRAKRAARKCGGFGLGGSDCCGMATPTDDCGCGGAGGFLLGGDTGGCSSCGSAASVGANYMPSAPAASQMAPVPPVPPVTTPAPMSPMTPMPIPEFNSSQRMSTPQSQFAQMQPQQVSYEEFQRLPGVIIQGPTPVGSPMATVQASGPTPLQTVSFEAAMPQAAPVPATTVQPTTIQPVQFLQPVQARPTAPGSPVWTPAH